MTRQIPVAIAVGSRPPIHVGDLEVTSPDEARTATAQLLRAVADVLDAGAELEELADRELR